MAEGAELVSEETGKRQVVLIFFLLLYFCTKMVWKTSEGAPPLLNRRGKTQEILFAAHLYKGASSFRPSCGLQSLFFVCVVTAR